MSFETVVVIVLFILIVIVSLLLYFARRKKTSDSLGHEPAVSTNGECPLCGEGLQRGERVHSVLFPGEEKGWMRIYGCRHCYADHPRRAEGAGTPLTRRICPYCREYLQPGGYVMAQVYEKPYRKTHVHVMGCTVCRPGRG